MYKITLLYLTHVGESAVEIDTEADSNDITEYAHDDEPSTCVFVMLYSLHLFLCLLFALFC